MGHSRQRELRPFLRGHFGLRNSRPLRALSRKRPTRAKLLGLFSGIGGFEKGFHSAGHITLAMAEDDPWASSVLAVQFPRIPNLGDVRLVGARRDPDTGLWRPQLHEIPRDVEVYCAGWPCQDLSVAGRKHGLYGDRSILAFEVLRMLEHRRTPVIVLENTPNMLNIGKGAAMRDIISRFEKLGYNWAYRTVDARSFGYNQRRSRVLFVLSNDPYIDPRSVLFADNEPEPEMARLERARPIGIPFETWQTVGLSFSVNEGSRGASWVMGAVGPIKVGSGWGIPSPPAILLPSGEVIKPHLSDAEALQGFPVGWTEPAALVGSSVSKTIGQRWKLIGNAVPVRMTAWVGERLRKPGDYDFEKDTKPVDPRRWPKAAWGGPEEGRWIAQGITQWPFPMDLRPLVEVLKFPGTPVSARAVRGFLGRLRAGSARVPAPVEAALMEHIRKMERK